VTRNILLLTLALGAASCDIKAVPVQFARICAPTNDCIFGGACDAQFIGDMRLDVAGLPATDKNFTLYVEIQNQAPSSKDLANGQINTRNAYLQEIHIEYEGVPLPSTTTFLQQSVPSAGSAVVGFQVVDAAGVSTLSGVVSASVSAQMLAKVTGKGVFGDGSSFETATYRIPFLACSGCVLNCFSPPSSLSCPHDGQYPNTCP
jgi:hypothetical protein